MRALIRHTALHMLLVTLAIGGAVWWQFGRTKPDDSALLAQAEPFLKLFREVHGRLPCPASTQSDGMEACPTSPKPPHTVLQGPLPWRSLHLSATLPLVYRVPHVATQANSTEQFSAHSPCLPTLTLADGTALPWAYQLRTPLGTGHTRWWWQLRPSSRAAFSPHRPYATDAGEIRLCGQHVSKAPSPPRGYRTNAAGTLRYAPSRNDAWVNGDWQPLTLPEAWINAPQLSWHGSADGQWMAQRLPDGSLQLAQRVADGWQMATDDALPLLREEAIGLAFHPRAPLLAVAYSQAPHVMIYRYSAGDWTLLTPTIPAMDAAPTAVGFDASGQALVLAYGTQWWLWPESLWQEDAAPPAPARRLAAPTGSTPQETRLAMAAGGSTLAITANHAIYFYGHVADQWVLSAPATPLSATPLQVDWPTKSAARVLLKTGQTPLLTPPAPSSLVPPMAQSTPD